MSQTTSHLLGFEPDLASPQKESRERKAPLQSSIGIKIASPSPSTVTVLLDEVTLEKFRDYERRVEHNEPFTTEE
ncbi:hypothetical protein MMC14_007550, partial [Varicellaria rhodocarpa]|nr:hypothetical protein [Varicellaria rhodocarpa]